MQAMNRFVEYFGAYMDEAGRLALADAAVVGMSTYHDRRELHIDLQLPALVETAELERCADQIAAQMGLEKAVLTPHYASAAFSADCLPSLLPTFGGTMRRLTASLRTPSYGKRQHPAYRPAIRG